LNNIKIVITGGPGSGKTEIIYELEKQGFYVMHEYSRLLFKEAKKKGVKDAFKDDPLKFSNSLLDVRIKQFKSASDLKYNLSKPCVFFDRGIHDIYAYLCAIKKKNDFKNIIFSYSYDLVFLLKPWEKIYCHDNERIESFSESKKFFNYIELVYKEAKIKTKIVPNDTIKNRVNFIINYMKKN